MRLHLGPIPDEFSPDGTWHPIREPGPLVMQLVAVPLGLGIALLFSWGWHRAGVTAAMLLKALPGLRAGPLWLLLLSLPVLVVVHELLHAAVHPRLGCSRATVLGAWPAKLLFYAHYSGPMSRGRFLLVLAMPFLVISIMPLALAAGGVLPHGWLMWAAWFSICNAAFACGDVLGLPFVLCQIPPGAMVQNQTWRTYWKPGG